MEFTIPNYALDRAEGHRFPAEFAVPSLPYDTWCPKAGLQKDMQTYEAAKEGEKLPQISESDLFPITLEAH